MSDTVKSRREWLFGVKKDYSLDRNKLIENYIDMMYDRSINMFEYNGLPDTVPQEELELLLQSKGFSVICKVKGNLYALCGGLGGKLNEYYRPTKFTVANPYLNYNAVLDIGKDCAIIRNDLNYNSLYSLFEKYAILLADCDITIRNNLINSRLHKLLYTSDRETKKSIDIIYNQLEQGLKPYSVLTSISLDNNKPIESTDFSLNTSFSFTEIIELRNYIKANWFIDLGLNYNYNMKREAINEFEASMNDDSLLPFVEHLLECRKKDLEKVNQLFNTNITVEFNSSWYQEWLSNEKSIEKLENIDTTEETKNDVEGDIKNAE